VELYQEFEYKMFAMLKKMGKDVVTWDSTFKTGMTLPSNTVVHDYQGTCCFALPEAISYNLIAFV
jgi:hypothetical protein